MGIAERREREKRMRRRQIVDAAKKIFSIKGFSGATMENIAQEAELSPATLYLYFTNKPIVTHQRLHPAAHVPFDPFRFVLEFNGLDQLSHALTYLFLRDNNRMFRRFLFDQKPFHT